MNNNDFDNDHQRRTPIAPIKINDELNNDQDDQHMFLSSDRDQNDSVTRQV